MVSDNVRITLDVDATAALASIDAVKAQADEQARQWATQRNTMLRQIREGFTLISQLMSTVRQAFSIFGQQIDPFYSALIGMVLATASMLLSAASVLSATVLGAPVGAVLFGLAIGFQILTLGKLVADKVHSEGVMEQMQSNLADLGSIVSRQGLGGFGEF